jgi:hypothetical protein
MPAKKDLKPQTPGDQPDLNQMPTLDDPNAQGANAELNAGGDDEPTPNEGGKIEISPEDLERLIDKAVEKRVVSEVKAVRRKQELAKNPQPENLPDQKDIDANKIGRAVLSKQGWVCPVVHPSDKRAHEMHGNRLN